MSIRRRKSATISWADSNVGGSWWTHEWTDQRTGTWDSFMTLSVAGQTTFLPWGDNNRKRRMDVSCFWRFYSDVMSLLVYLVLLLVVVSSIKLLGLLVSVKIMYVCMYVCACVCVRACVRACVHACMYVCQHFQTSCPLKPLCRLKPNFMWILHGTRERNFVQMVQATWPSWPPCPYMVKTFKNLLLWNQRADDLET